MSPIPISPNPTAAIIMLLPLRVLSVKDDYIYAAHFTQLIKLVTKLKTTELAYYYDSLSRILLHKFEYTQVEVSWEFLKGG